MKYVIFQIYAPIVSWGNIAVGGERTSTPHPSKSALTGIVAAALGIRRNQEDAMQQLTQSLSFSIKMYSSGMLLSDFHTVQAPRNENKKTYYTRKEETEASVEKIGTIVSRRQYRSDALYVVGLSMNINSPYTYEAIEQALRTPVFQIYFGRKACVPALPLAPKVIDADTAQNALDSYQVIFPTPQKEDSWQHTVYEKVIDRTFSKETATYYWEENAVMNIKPLHITERYDSPVSKTKWQFAPRKEYMALAQNLEEGTSCILVK